MAIVAAAPEDIIISAEYDPSGENAWADMWDNTVIGWAVPDAGGAPTPVIIGSLPPPVTAEVAPQWILIHGTWATVPDKWRGRLFDLFDFLTNDGTRQLRGNFSTHQVANTWELWSNQHPEAVWPGLPPQEAAAESNGRRRRA
jgi:hypothetical protein